MDYASAEKKKERNKKNLWYKEMPKSDATFCGIVKIINAAIDLKLQRRSKYSSQSIDV